MQAFAHNVRHRSLPRALQLLAAGQLDEARIYLEEFIRQDPDNPDLHYNLGLCYMNLREMKVTMAHKKL